MSGQVGTDWAGLSNTWPGMGRAGPSKSGSISRPAIVRVLMRNFKGKASLEIVDVSFTDLSEKNAVLLIFIYLNLDDVLSKKLQHLL